MPSLPWFKWLVSRWRNCKPRLLLTRDERLLYLELLFALHEWKGAIPNNPQQLALLAAFPQDAFDAAWPVVSGLFVPHPSGEPDMITNLTALEIIEEQADKYERTSLQRQGAARTRWNADAGRIAGRNAGRLQKQKKKREAEGAVEEHTCSSLGAERVSSLLVSSPRNPTSELTELQANWFEAFYASSWRKVGRAAALKAFRRHVATAERFAEVMAAVEQQRDEMMAREERFRPHPSTWLNGEHWRNEQVPEPGTPRRGENVRH